MEVFLLNKPFLTINSARGTYDIFMGDSVSYINFVASSGNVVLLIDENVARLHNYRLKEVFNRIPVLVISACENNKSWVGVEQVVQFFLFHGCNRSTKVVVIGGGIIQDISAFACHIFFRGIKWEFFPTTVLAMADSCIGAKSGLNFENTKNLVGVFESPQKVIIDILFTDTLKKDDLCSGLGEIFKLALIAGGKSFQLFYEGWHKEQLQGDDLEVLVTEALKIKKIFIEQDEFDYGVRRILNYGHTFGHALESVTQYAIPHGIAVVIGMDLVNFIAVQYGLMSSRIFDQLHKIMVDRFLFPDYITNNQIDELILAASKDKKRTINDGLNLVVLSKPGEWDMKQFVLDEKLKNTVKSYFESVYPVVGSTI